MDFFKQYEKWTEECRTELKEQGFNPEHAAICENGQVKFIGSLYSITQPGFVTPWFDSEHFIE